MRKFVFAVLLALLAADSNATVLTFSGSSFSPSYTEGGLTIANTSGGNVSVSSGRWFTSTADNDNSFDITTGGGVRSIKC